MYTIDQTPSAGHCVQIKICGITIVEDALACAAMGADALGLVFYPRSPRYVSLGQAAEICSVLPPSTAKVGVFVNESYEKILQTASACRLSAVQLHGQESPELVEKLAKHDFNIIKCLYLQGSPSTNDTKNYNNVDSFLVECSAGKLPGGNAMTWDWSAAKKISKNHPTVIAGGLSPENVSEAINASYPDAVDVSSGVELFPGRKDRNMIREFINAVHMSPIQKTTRRIF
jgi:phosphoribosylanthranilate isomerase